MIQIKVFTSMSAHTFVNVLLGGGGVNLYFWVTKGIHSLIIQLTRDN